jgi:hypothetical protein
VIADRVLEYLTNARIPVVNKEKMKNDVAAAWFDPNNSVGYEHAGENEAILWVQSSFLSDQLESAGKPLGYKGELIKTLITREEIHGESVRRRWTGPRAQFHPFDPDALNVSEEDIGEGADETAHSEVEP